MRRHTRLSPVADVPGLRLHVADDVTTLWHAAGRILSEPDPPLPYWAFAWAGGLAVARHLVANPEEVAGRTVLDIASGSGLCAIVALRAGARRVDAVDIDRLAEAAIAVNSSANRVRPGFRRVDLLDAPPPPYDVVLAGDVCYEEPMAVRMLRWLAAAAAAGSRVLIGDPGRRFLPRDLERIATYRVSTSRELESTGSKDVGVFTIPAGTALMSSAQIGAVRR